MTKRTILFLIITFIFINIHSQIGFQDKIVTGAAYYPRSIFAIDLDGDADLDLLFSSRGGDKIAWFENLDGQGNFGEQNIITQNTHDAMSVYATDIDGDGDYDVISASRLDDKIAWYENLDGQGNFGTEQIVSSNVDNIRKAISSDVDGDGDMDILAAVYTAGKIVWFENNGSGDFGEEQVIKDNLQGAESVFTSDLDGDGDLDVLSANSVNSKIAWYENLDGQGNFSAIHIISTNANGSSSVFTGDIDGDGDLDVLSSSFNDDKIAWYENLDGLGNFGTQQVITTLSDSAISVYAKDLDNDGDLDVLSASRLDDKIAWYENLDGQGSFSSQNIITNNANFATQVIANDINGNGNIDVISCSSEDGKIAWYENLDGQGDFSSQHLLTSNADGANYVFSSDIDGDGFMDILSTSENDNKVSWYKNIDGQGQFSLQKVITTSALKAKSVYTSDLDGDGFEDVISASFNDNKIAWYKNIDGQGNFSSQQIITSNALGAISVFAIDIDNDNDIDILSASEFDNKIAWYENDGLGNFGVPQIISDNANKAKYVYSFDMDNDGDADVISASSDDNKIAWYENDGLGNFGNEQIITTLNDVEYVNGVDIDNDGDLDILVASLTNVGWVENIDGNGNFGDRMTLLNSNYLTYHVTPSDFDNDGDIDIVYSSYVNLLHPTNLFWLENTEGTFSSHDLHSAGIGISYLFSKDLNNDGKIDFISSSFYDDKIIWHKNLGILGNKINGSIYFDINNSNCDNTSQSLSNILIATDNGSNNFSTFSQENGSFSLKTNEGNFITNIMSLPNYFSFSPNSHSSNFTGLENTDTINYCVTANQTINDVNISLIPTSQARPGFETTYQIVYKNVGTTQLSGNISLEFDETKLSFLNASENINSQTSNSLTFDYLNLNPFETRTIGLDFNVSVPPTTEIDDILSFTTTVNPIVNDYTTDDNIFILNQTVIGSYDPNDIICLEGNEILYTDKDKYLHYIIRFQNTGTASAINVVVKNILDNHLDWSTLQLESLSHNNRVTIKNGNEVEFIFKNINLPDSTTDEPNSHGFIAYKIKPKADIALDDTILNKADILFDYNSPIETNTVSTTIVNVLAVSKNTLDFSVYPTPTENILNIKSKNEISKIEIYSKLGQLILRNEAENNINISKLTNGLYFVKMEDVNGNFGVKKIIKN